MNGFGRGTQSAEIAAFDGGIPSPPAGYTQWLYGGTASGAIADEGSYDTIDFTANRSGISVETEGIITVIGNSYTKKITLIVEV